ncbi:hypothetical protein N7468_009946 [Penicillium chermesinum]|uniref:Uncharacterized protein n=1 Tax=Penicillium chermesinum TaxID=63820 RepID=A0A9W9NDN2_9EURO|nr:uncharacterized protein N7468_009946 [Penicillium chermesinum]KAJ5216938.1 hypothetical protein N7468_009946 [Penicillium chermesinum]KAJ6171449.1 hypothetical protein N7470_000516 [Penicillium chermesinum]
MARPAMALRKVHHLPKAFPTTSSALLRISHLALPAPFLTPDVQPSHATTRSFHSTQERQAAPAPATRRRKLDREVRSAHAQSWVNAGRPSYSVDSDGLSLYVGKEGQYESVLRDVQLEAPALYEAGIRDGVIPRSISYGKFQEIGRRLVRASFEGRPNANAIKAISSDVDAIWRIGFMTTHRDSGLKIWILHSCARAKARIPVVLVARQQLRDDGVPGDTIWNKEVAKLSNQGFPPAMLLHAKILSLRGKYTQALELLEDKIMPCLVATRDRPGPVEDITLGGQIESPLRLGAVIFASVAARLEGQGRKEAKDYYEKSDDWTLKAALEFNDIDALVDYASLMMNNKDYDAYEEAMAKAATGGSAKACFFLANFYFRTSLGEFPTRDQRALPAYDPDDRSTWDLEPGSTILSRFWKWWAAPIESSIFEYKNLAFEWYLTSVDHGDIRAGMMAGLLYRDDKQYQAGLAWMDNVLKGGLDADPLYGPKALEMVKHWNDINYEIAIPKKMLPVR